MKKNKSTLFSYEKQIEILKKAIKECTSQKITYHLGLCAYIDAIYEGREYVSGFVSNHLTLFNQENAQNFNEAFKSYKSEFASYWWEVCKLEPRMEFLKWLLVETEKLLEESK